ncbi:MAG TPA: hypothetical protein VK211_20895, partial [Kamptonema sp.]|nr:hypothetical protein [Kamptonema sp.]
GLVRSKNGADDLLLLMEKEAQKYIINMPKLQVLLQWADEVTKGSEGDFKSVGKRAAAIAITIVYVNDFSYNTNPITIAEIYAIPFAKTHTEVIDITNANANTIESLYAVTYAIAHAKEFQKIKIFKDVNWNELIAQLEIIKTQVPDGYQPVQVHLAFFDCFLHILYNALHLAPEIVKLSNEEAEALEDYLYANYLIIQCKEAAVRISATTWEEIESRMLLVPEN